MFSFIRGMFAKSEVASNFNPHSGDGEPSIHNLYVHEFPKFPSIDCPYLSQSELQMLQRLVAERIQAEDTSRRSAIAIAKVYPNDYDTQDSWYRLANKASVKISKLSKLQYRLKHRIAAKG